MRKADDLLSHDSMNCDLEWNDAKQEASWLTVKEAGVSLLHRLCQITCEMSGLEEILDLRLVKIVTCIEVLSLRLSHHTQYDQNCFNIFNLMCVISNS